MNPAILLVAALLGAIVFGSGIVIGWLLADRTPIRGVRRQNVQPANPAPATPNPSSDFTLVSSTSDLTPGFRPPTPNHRLSSPPTSPLSEDPISPPPPSQRRGPYAYGGRTPEESAAIFEELQEALRRRETSGPFDGPYQA